MTKMVCPDWDAYGSNRMPEGFEVFSRRVARRYLTTGHIGGLDNAELAHVAVRVAIADFIHAISR